MLVCDNIKLKFQKLLRHCGATGIGMEWHSYTWIGLRKAGSAKSSIQIYFFHLDQFRVNCVIAFTAHFHASNGALLYS